MLISVSDRKQFIRTLTPGRTFHTHRGILKHDDLIDSPLGAVVTTHLGHRYYLTLPTTDELVRNIKRHSQIIYPKDAGYIIMKLGIKPGSRVLEAGTGSGGLTTTLATLVGAQGHVYSYDVRDDMQNLTRKNLDRIGLAERVTLKQRDAAEGFDETDLDAVFLDMPTPWQVLDQARAALRGSGMVGSLVPTVNQLQQLIESLEQHRAFGFVEAEELLLRPFKTIPARVRPEDRIVGHTGYLIFARAIIPPPADASQDTASSHTAPVADDGPGASDDTQEE